MPHVFGQRVQRLVPVVVAVMVVITIMVVIMVVVVVPPFPVVVLLFGRQATVIAVRFMTFRPILVVIDLFARVPIVIVAAVEIVIADPRRATRAKENRHQAEVKRKSYLGPADA
jgi:hypothetical protein